MTEDDRVLLVEALTEYYERAVGALLCELQDVCREYSPEVRGLMISALGCLQRP